MNGNNGPPQFVEQTALPRDEAVRPNWQLEHKPIRCTMLDDCCQFRQMNKAFPEPSSHRPARLIGVDRASANRLLLQE